MPICRRPVAEVGQKATFCWIITFRLRARGDLWLPIGLHFGWNLALTLLEGNLSGITMGVTGFVLRWKNATIWSGGLYGLEGSPLTAVAVVVLFFVIRRVLPEGRE